MLAAVLLVAACSPATVLNALAAHDTSMLTAGVAYGSGPRRKLDVYRPTGAAPAAGWPLAVFFYGGSWNSGSRGDYRFVGEALASRGIVALVADYRLYPEVRYPDFLADCAQALAYALDHARSLGGDPKRVFVVGHSAGGYNAAMLALDARWLHATGHEPAELAGWAGLAGAYDFFPSDNPDVRPVFHHPHYPRGGQPVEHAGAPALPAFLGAARTDSLVDPRRNTVGLATRLQAAGAPVTLRLYGRVGYTTLVGAFAAPLRFLAPVLDDLAKFVDTTPAIAGGG
jgi:acetyl esterase/lipase